MTKIALDDARIVARVEAGAAWLDKHHPGWFEPVAKAMQIDAAKPFSLARAEACVLGTVFGDYYRVMQSHYSDEEKAEYDALYPSLPVDVPLLSECKAEAFAFCTDAADAREASMLFCSNSRDFRDTLGEYDVDNLSHRTTEMYSGEDNALAWLRLEFWWRLAVAKRLGMI